MVEGLHGEDRARFAFFVSASARCPPLDWRDLGLVVQRNGAGDDRLPTAYTCFVLLLLPRYSSAAVPGESLLQAIRETRGFGLN